MAYDRISRVCYTKGRPPLIKDSLTSAQHFHPFFFFFFLIKKLVSPSHDYVEDSVCFADLPFHMLGQFQQSFYPTLRSPISDVPEVGLYLIYVAKCLSYFTPDGVPYIFCLH